MNFCPRCASPLENHTIDNVVRLQCTKESCAFTHWNNPTPVVAAIVQLNDAYILARNKAWDEGMFSMITGFVEAGETPETTVLRELKEELGLSSKQLDFIGHFNFKPLNQLMIAYHVEAAGNITLNDEIIEVQNIPEQSLKEHDFGQFILTKQIVLAWLQKGAA